MPLTWLIFCVIAIAAAGAIMGRARVFKSADGNTQNMHSRPVYYVTNVVSKVLVSCFLIVGVWLIAHPIYVGSVISAGLPDSSIADGSSRSLLMAEVRRTAEGLDAAVAAGMMAATEAQDLRADLSDVTQRLKDAGQIVTSEITQPILNAAQNYRAMQAQGQVVLSAITLIVALGALIWGLRDCHKDFWARNAVERSLRLLLIGAASIAIFTTLGIVLSLIFNTYEFFQLYPWTDFFFGLTWAPSFSGRGGASDLGVLPLLWGTFYISIVALIVAVPTGLFAAIYLSEYAGPKTRAIAKPLIEVLAGIPTIVYGLFALLTVGPLLVSIFGKDGLNIMQSGTAVMTAGLVMGIMLIPFVSSLSDDIINAVPQSMRDGSYGLGATKSETIRQVVLPAALPGIVGAILLAASRAIGETMIVVLGAGAAARLSMNPFDAMTTVTAKIVSQLTGDADFASPEALVAFALGMTLFVITLGLNVLALVIVRKYREQYE